MLQEKIVVADVVIDFCGENNQSEETGLNNFHTWFCFSLYLAASHRDQKINT